jgi:hypothetical protein
MLNLIQFHYEKTQSTKTVQIKLKFCFELFLRTEFNVIAISFQFNPIPFLYH